MSKREIRRRHYRRRKAREVRKWKVWAYGPEDGWPGEERIGFYADTPQPCSCYMCGNPRYHFGELTRQEMRANESWQKGFDLCDG